MSYKEIQRPAMKLVGLAVDTTAKNISADCQKVWADFINRVSEIKNVTDGKVFYGACTSSEPCDVCKKMAAGEEVDLKDCTCVMHYLAGVEVSEANELPAGMESMDVPEAKYLSFVHKGKIDSLMNTYSEITKIVKDEKRTLGSVWLEAYGGLYKHDSDDSEFDILVPIK
ncbi:MAG: effector binding domain-containing protein [Patescibacteria group bacterium]|nr:effector binding domain-containing protein [Patescibacteria group bacterium]